MTDSKVILAFVAGAAIGAFAGVLIAPSKGSELRNEIAGKAREILDIVLAKAEEIVEEAEEISYRNRAAMN